ncbi:MAG TPA: WG repeat-containing protein [Acidobacteriota bacterium]
MQNYRNFIAIVFIVVITSAIHSADTQTQNSVVLFPVPHENLWGYINADGKIVIEPQFNMAFEFAEGVAQVMVKDRWGYIDPSGKFVIQPKFARSDRFYEGFARVCIDPAIAEFAGYIDKTGTLVIPTEGAEYLGKFSEGLAAMKIKGKFGFIDRTGKFVIQPKYDVADIFTEGLARVAIKKGEKYLWGFIDKSGKERTSLQFEDACNFSEGLACVGVGNLFGFINTDGNFVINPKYDFTGDFQEGLAPVHNVKFGYIDRSGKMVIPEQFDIAHGFSEGMAAVAQDPGNGSPVWGFIDKEGNFVIEPQYDDVGAEFGSGSFQNGLVIVKVGKYSGYVSKTGKLVWQPCSSCNIPAN